MQTLTYVLYQMDEAVRYINEGRLEQLRLALLLLDNAAELQIDRRVRRERQSEDLRERIRLRAISTGAAGRSPALDELVAWDPLTSSAKKRIERVFDAKLEYLTRRRRVLDPRLARILSYLHRYRNEAYHSARVRRETIRTAALILVEANCELLQSVFSVQMYSSDEDYSWVLRRFGLERPAMISEDTMSRIVAEIRSPALPKASDVAETLTSHLQSRIGQLLDGLDFIVHNTAVQNRAAALAAAQLAAGIDRGEIDSTVDTRDFKAAWSLRRVSGLERRVASLSTTADRMAAFEAFSRLEVELEPVERDVDGLVAVVDAMIQHQIDLARGK